MRADNIKNQIRKPELKISETEKYRLSNKNPKPATSNETFENIFKAEVERESEILMDKNDWEDLSTKKTQTKDSICLRNYFQGNGQEYFPKKCQLLTHFVS